MTKKEKSEIINEVVAGITAANAPKETDAEKKHRILRITNTRERQRAIRENIGLFAGDILIGGRKIDEL